MAIEILSLTGNGGSTLLVSSVVQLPFTYSNWPAGIAALVNFSGGGFGYTVPGAPAAAVAGTGGVGGSGVTVQVSNDPNNNVFSGNQANNLIGRWNNHDVLVNLTTDKNDSIVYMCRYVRMIGYVTSGTVSLFLGFPDTAFSNQ